MVTRHAMGPWLHLSVHCRGPNWHCTGQLIPRHCTSRHILCCSSFPLRPIHRGRIRYHRRLRPLIPAIQWLYTRLNLSKNPLPHYICRGQHNFFPSTLPRPLWNTTTILRLPRRLHNMKHSILYGIIHLAYSSNPDGIHSLRGFRIKTRGLNSRTHNNQP